MAIADITISDEDRGVLLDLRVEYAYRPAVAATWNEYWGGDPGAAERVDWVIQRIGLISLDFHGKFFEADWTAAVYRPSLRKAIEEKYSDEIDAAVLEVARDERERKVTEC